MSHISHPFQSKPRATLSLSRFPTTKRIIFLAGAALVISGCSDAQQTAEELRSKTDAAIDAKGVANAIHGSVNEEAVVGAIKGAAAVAIREELGPVGAIVDEDALVSGIDTAIDGQAVTGAIGQTVSEVARGPALSEQAAE